MQVALERKAAWTDEGRTYRQNDRDHHEQRQKQQPRQQQ
jgi:hypothetical protein